MVVIKLDGPAQLCKKDEVGELCVSAGYTGFNYWGLQGITQTTFQVRLWMDTNLAEWPANRVKEILFPHLSFQMSDCFLLSVFFFLMLCTYVVFQHKLIHLLVVKICFDFFC